MAQYSPEPRLRRTGILSLTIWTVYEVGYLWAAANGKVPYLKWKDNPIWFVLFFFIIVLFRDVHFYFVHRLLHVKPIFKHVHSLHHRNNNVAPWSGMSMHPIEHLLYMSGVLIHFVVPSNPVHFLFHTIHLALTPVSGHTGFEGPLFEGKLPVGSFSHYLHHKYVNCNFGGSTVPLDRWLGTFYNGFGKFTFTRSKKPN